MYGFDQRDGGQALVRDRFLGYSPHLSHMLAMFGVLDVAGAGELVAFLSLFAGPLAVALASDHSVAAAGAADSSRSDHKIDCRHAVVHALGVVLDTARVEEKAGPGLSPKLSGPDDHGGGHPGDFCREFRGVLADGFFDGIEAGCVFGDELAVDPSVFDHDVEHSIEDANVSTGTDRNEQIHGAGDWSHPRIENDNPGTVLSGSPQVVGGNRRALGDIGAGDKDYLSFDDVAPRVSAAVYSKNLLRRGRCRYHAKAAVIVNVSGPERYT